MYNECKMKDDSSIFMKMMAITDEVYSLTDNDCQNKMPFILSFFPKNNLTTYIYIYNMYRSMLQFCCNIVFFKLFIQ